MLYYRGLLSHRKTIQPALIFIFLFVYILLFSVYNQYIVIVNMDKQMEENKLGTME
ncbi:hypothetical protein UAW_01728 [Enterococcus haemoperoxidus ATCC BAA-382]|uniref:Uncharacterized protein n=1 Tax=Enterococcus haemoperoxidus ATCC BAA-382 TaxID=1158608 RepID=R2SNK9_9ENTE|nr:hypothetical protein UAW_01728 [Enterococcus haemoperoxidus ATCC BAA-382]EOT60059.1 hypothetical protein I583_02694 [Enterococcus haemoperoxidus ATCC BAA-382]